MLESSVEFAKGLLSSACASILVKIQLTFIAGVIAVIALITVAALVCAVIVKINPGMKNKIFHFIEKI